MDGVRRVLYRLPRVMDAIKNGETIYICEGEKDVESLEKLGVCATTNPGGAEKWKPGFSELLKNSNVIILPDNDEPGRRHAEQIKKS